MSADTNAEMNKVVEAEGAVAAAEANSLDALISVIIPAYNAEKYLGECLDSILKQTYTNLEVVVINDGSADGTWKVIEDYMARDARVKGFDYPHAGLAAGVVRGLTCAKGDYIGWVDADDFIDPDMYEKLMKPVVEEGADYVFCDYCFYPHKVPGKEKWFKEYKGVLDWHYLERNNQRWKSLTSRELIDRIHLTEIWSLYDEYCWMAVMINANKTVTLTEELYNYRVGIESDSGGSYKGKVEKFRKGAENSARLHNIVPAEKDTEDLREYFQYRYIYALLQYEIVAAVNENKAAYKDAAKQLAAVHFKKNKYTKLILDNNHGKLKSFVLRNLITAGYGPAVMIAKKVYGDK